MPREHGRKLRVGAELHRLLNEVLRMEVKDPRLHGVTINEVEVSGDLGVAKIYYATLDPDDDAREAQAAFRKASGFLRSRIGQAVRLRRVPELHFVRDTSARRGFELSKLIDSVRAGEQQEDDGTAAAPDDASGGESDEASRSESDEASRSESDEASRSKSDEASRSEPDDALGGGPDDAPRSEADGASDDDRH